MSGSSSVITCRFDIDVDLKHSPDIFMPSVEIDSGFTSSFLLAELYTIHP